MPDTAERRPRREGGAQKTAETSATSIRRWYAAGLEHGIEIGRQLAGEEMVAATRTAVGAAELELRRWGPGGRQHFADPRLGDYPGRVREAAA